MGLLQNTAFLQHMVLVPLTFMPYTVWIRRFVTAPFNIMHATIGWHAASIFSTYIFL